MTIATVRIVEKNGAGGTQTVKDNTGTIRFKNADDSNEDSNDPLVVPGAGYDYSYEKWLILKVTVAPETDISNLVFYTDGSNDFGSGIEMYAKSTASYSTPAEATGTAGYADAFSYTDSSTLSLGAGPYTGTGEKGNHCVMFIRIDNTAGTGTLSGETLYFGYDES